MDSERRFERVYADNYETVLRYFLRRSGREDVLDGAAETFTVAWRRREDMPKDSELQWLYGVARRVLANQRRAPPGGDTQQRVDWGVVETDRIDEPEPQLVRKQEYRDVLAALAHRKESDQEIIRLAGWEELGREELSAVIGCTTNAVTKRLNRALDRLGRELGIVERAHVRQFRRGGAA